MQSPSKRTKVFMHLNSPPKYGRKKNEYGTIKFQFWFCFRFNGITFGICVDSFGNSTKIYPAMISTNHGESRACVGAWSSSYLRGERLFVKCDFRRVFFSKIEKKFMQSKFKAANLYNFYFQVCDTEDWIYGDRVCNAAE